MSKKVVVIGGGGHSKVVIDCIQCQGDTVVGILDDGADVGVHVLSIPVLGKICDYSSYKDCRFIIAIGNNSVRKRIAEQLDGEVSWHTAVHPSATVSQYAEISNGTVVLPNAVINAEARVGAHCIINSGAVVEHDNLIEDYVHISPNASLGGTVRVGSETHIGIGATVRNNIQICEKSVIGAGAVVVKNITESGTYVGVPAGRIG